MTRLTNFQIAASALERGANMTEVLRAHLGLEHNTPEIIEICYDLQAGSYVQFAQANRDYVGRYAAQLAENLAPELRTGDVILDVGAGEFTNLSHLLGCLAADLELIYAFDISFSRVLLGREYASHVAPSRNVLPLVAEISEIPLRDNSVDVLISNHALEPNGGNEALIMKELFRVAARKLVLFEPHYEINEEEGKARMDRLGYIRNLPETVESLGGTLDRITPMKILDNPLNTTACFVITPPGGPSPRSPDAALSVPGTDYPLEQRRDCFFSPELGVSFPVVESLPLLRRRFEIITSLFALPSRPAIA